MPLQVLTRKKFENRVPPARALYRRSVAELAAVNDGRRFNNDKL